MDLATNYESDPQRLPRLTREEQRIADAIVAALAPQLQRMDNRLENIENRLDGVVNAEGQQTALIQANHEDFLSVQQQLADFRVEQNEAWALNGEVWNRLDANVQILIDEAG